jgi:hypothetical protein
MPAALRGALVRLLDGRLGLRPEPETTALYRALPAPSSRGTTAGEARRRPLVGLELVELRPKLGVAECRSYAIVDRFPHERRHRHSARACEQHEVGVLLGVEPERERLHEPVSSLPPPGCCGWVELPSSSAISPVPPHRLHRPLPSDSDEP